MRDSRILLLIVITVLGDVSRLIECRGLFRLPPLSRKDVSGAGPHKRRDENQPQCMKKCIQKFNEDPEFFSELIPGAIYCKGIRDLEVCWNASCTTKEEKALLNIYVEMARNFFQDIYHHLKCEAYAKLNTY